MKYMGSKNRHAKSILPIILENRKQEQWYVEPFVGGFNLIDKVVGKRIANDSHPYLISLFKSLQSGWQPPNTISELEYLEIKNNPENFPKELVGFVGFGCSFSGKWWGGYARGNTNKGLPRNYCLESKKNLLKQVDKISGISIFCVDYKKLYIPENSIIYCDPPYFNTTQYLNSFDTVSFWGWCDEMVELGHRVFVSEYIAPPHWISKWSKVVNNSLDLNTGAKQGIENLFISSKESLI